MHEFYYSCICFEFSKTFQPVIFRKTKETVNVVGISILKWHRGLQYFCDAAFGTYLVGFLMSNEMRSAAEGPCTFRTLKGSLSCKICRILLQRWRQKNCQYLSIHYNFFNHYNCLIYGTKYHHIKLSFERRWVSEKNFIKHCIHCKIITSQKT